ncbi:MAG: 2-nonaprenyl-3-methyl-6-methoxy,4-benzoquinol hydroxylase [Pseudomonadota bacterium]
MFANSQTTETLSQPPLGKLCVFHQRSDQSAKKIMLSSGYLLLQHNKRAKLSPMNADTLILAADSALRTLFATPRSARPTPKPQAMLAVQQDGALTAPVAIELTAAEKSLSASLMRVNHVGEVCAQALYTGQALASNNPALRAKLDAACREESDHLAWTHERLEQLNSRPSLLNPIWYAGSFAIGYAAGKLGGDKLSLGFVVETENQVEAHLASHMSHLPANDLASKAIVAQMKTDEAAHARMAQKSGAVELPEPVKRLMGAAAKVMTTVAHRI